MTVRVLQKSAVRLRGKTGEVLGSWTFRGRRVLRVMIEGVPWGFYAATRRVERGSS
ncbi:hypothetical protein [Polyangium sp. 6x1]|uniref:hypothetical protein n=1 Tax=Polyangium sp. 6x1 TaxID=3042689 RepID=UPI0024822151|nr:hypothetical protein [Polyangium sp. 6x1]MDI1444655.1 hypothetical protein [Polyangium sp. 6x1]